MTERLLIGEFLERNQDFIFRLPECIESTRFIARAKERFESFCRSFSTDYFTTTSWQTKRKAIERVVREVPAYGCIDWTRSDYWESIPLFDKDAVRAHPDDFLSPAYDRKQLWLRETSGTTGPPVPIWYAPEFAFEFQLFMALKIAWLAGALTDHVRRRPIFCCVLTDKKFLRNRVWARPDGFRGLTLVLVFDEGRPNSVNKIAALLDRHRPAILSTKPNILASMLRHVGEPLKAAASHLELIISGGADLDEDLRQAGQRFFGVPIIDAYGLTEVGLIASECIQRDGLHVYEQDMIPEILLDDGRVQGTGTGELVVSSVANPAMPFLRYRTGDLVELTSEPCQCGKRGRRIRSISGRLVRNFRLRDGSEFAPTNFDGLFKLFPIREFRLTQTVLDRIQAEIEFLPSCPNPKEELESVRNHIEREMRFLVRVDISQTVFRPGDKFQRYRTLV